MSDTAYLDWPFFEPRHAELAQALDAWATQHVPHDHGPDVDAECRALVQQLGKTIVMVTHDPVSASYADRIVFLKDGKIAGELLEPTPELVLDYMKKLGH